MKAQPLSKRKAVRRPRPGRPRRHEGPVLTPERLAETLLTIARRDGKSALNIRFIAAELGVSTRLIYHFVDSKDALFDLLVDAMLATCPQPPEHLPWQDRLRFLMRNTREIVLQYPGIAHYALRRVSHFHARSALRNAESARSVLYEAGLPEFDAVATLHVLQVFAFGHVILSESFARGHVNRDLYSVEAVEASFETGLEDLIQGIERRASRR